MAVLKYRDPVSGEYVPLSLVGQAGDPGPPGPPGPDGSPGTAEIAIGDAAPTAGEKIWVQLAATVKDDGTDETAIQIPMAKFQYHDGSTYKVPAQLRGERLVSVGAPAVASDAATVGYARQGLVTADTDWKYPSFVNGWRNYGPPYAGAAYRRLGNGMVAVQGLIAAGTMATPAFYLEPGYRPPNQLNLSSHGGGNGMVLVEFLPNGAVQPHHYGSTGNNAHVSVNFMFPTS